MINLSEASPEHLPVLKEVLKFSIFPWDSLPETIHVYSRPMQMNLSGQWWASGNRAQELPQRTILLNSNMRESNVGFTFAHELGHAVDTLYLDRQSRQELISLMHTVLPQLGHFNHDHKDAGHTSEVWNASQHYPSRLNEAFADLFVRAFCPKQWKGRFPRFVHWTDDLDVFKAIVLDTLPKEVKEDPVAKFSDVSDTNTHAEGIDWAAEQGLVNGYPDGTFRPDNLVTRAQLASILMRALKK